MVFYSAEGTSDFYETAQCALHDTSARSTRISNELFSFEISIKSYNGSAAHGAL